eukprot:gene6045-7530_t
MNTTSYIEKKERVVQRKNPLAQLSPAKKTSFQHAVVEKSDVGEFQGGYFIMPGAVSDDRMMKRPTPQQHQQHRNSPQRKTNRLPTNNNNSSSTTNNQPEEIDLKTYKQQQQQQYNNLKNIHNNLKQQQQQNNNSNCSNNLNDDFLLTPDSFNVKDLKLDNNNTPSKKFNNQTYTKILSPQSTKYASSSSSYQNNNYNNSTSNSPPRSNSPNKKSLTSPQSTSCWAGGAFNNSPAPNSLPIPNFEDEESSSCISPPQPTVNLESMTFDLRRLLNITPVQVSDVSV